MTTLNLTLIGDISIPDDFDTIFSSDGEYLITRSLGDSCCFEMSGESMYYALQEIEKYSNINYSSQRAKIIKAIMNRLSSGGGRLFHKSFIGDYDTQFRATNSALRTLLSASRDGFKVDEEIAAIANFQFSYYFNWKNGFWFCHDSSEFSGNAPLSHIHVKRIGKNARNTLTLNTHLDSVSTLLLLKKYRKEQLLNFDLDLFLSRGLISIDQLLDVKSGNSKGEAFIQKIDNYFLSKHIDALNKSRTLVSRFYERIIHPICFKVLFPTIFFNNGFIARDLSVMNRHIDYLLVNIVDFSRVVNLYKMLIAENLIDNNYLRFNLLLKKLDKAIGLVESNSGLLNSINMDELQSAWYAEMYFTISNANKKYMEKAQQIYDEHKYCSNSPFYHLNFNRKC